MKKCMEALIITISLLLFGCASTNPRNSGTKTTEAEKAASKISDTRETVEKQLSNDEKEIYNYVFAVLLRNNSSRVSVENGQVSEIPATKIVVSNIGFNPANDIAIIEISFRKSGWSGYTNYLVFGKKNTGWKVIDVLQTVVS